VRNAGVERRVSEVAHGDAGSAWGASTHFGFGDAADDAGMSFRATGVPSGLTATTASGPGAAAAAGDVPSTGGDVPSATGAAGSGHGGASSAGADVGPGACSSVCPIVSARGSGYAAADWLLAFAQPSTGTTARTNAVAKRRVDFMWVPTARRVPESLPAGGHAGTPQVGSPGGPFAGGKRRSTEQPCLGCGEGVTVALLANLAKVTQFRPPRSTSYPA
jgi:hypothetical protein